jgi:dienelactone hydrolase
MTTQRTPEEIRASIESHRQELAQSVTDLSVGVSQATDWRRQVSRHPQEIAGAAAVAGFLLGGGIVALGGLLSR